MHVEDADIETATTEDTPPEPVTYPAGDYGIVEVMGHVRHIGLVAEVERFGQKFCEVRPIKDHVIGEPILVGGASIYQFRTCTAEAAYAATESWEYRRAKNPPAQLQYVGEEQAADDEEDFRYP